MSFEEQIDLDRESLLKEIWDRMIKNDIFYSDIWDRVLQTKTRILKEIVDSDFEEQVKRMRQ